MGPGCWRVGIAVMSFALLFSDNHGVQSVSYRRTSILGTIACDDKTETIYMAGVFDPHSAYRHNCCLRKLREPEEKEGRVTSHALIWNNQQKWGGGFDKDR